MHYEGTALLKSRGIRAFRAKKEVVKNYYWFDKIEKGGKKKVELFKDVEARYTTD